MEDESIASIDMTHGSYLSIPGRLNANYKHCIPLQPEVTLPRVSLVFRRVDKKYIHPSENKIRNHRDKDWKDFKDAKGKIVEVRRQTLPSE